MFKKIIFVIAIASLVFILNLAFKKESKILFVGDMNFDRHIRKVQSEKGDTFVFSCLKDLLEEADLVVGNLEGPITLNKSVSLGSKIGSPENFVFTFDPSIAKLLADHNVRLVNLGNNHIDDFGREGMLSTRDFLVKAGVDYFGGFGGEEPIVRMKLGQTKVSFISYNQFGGDAPKKVAEKIKKESQEGRLVIVYTHWGEEYVLPNAAIKNTAKLFADSGAKLIIGSHPHVILPSEKIPSNSRGQEDTLVYYSLGNFIFDQYWNTDVSTGLVLEVKIKNGQIEILEHRVVMQKDGRTCLATD